MDCGQKDLAENVAQEGIPNVRRFVVHTQQWLYDKHVQCPYLSLVHDVNCDLLSLGTNYVCRHETTCCLDSRLCNL